MKTITYNPETHVLVPRDPTEEMFAAANKIDDEMYCGGSQHGADIDQVYYAMIAAAPQPEPVESEPVIIEEPNYHFEAMGCGLEDRNITDRYEAMQYGWDCAISRMFEQIPDEPLYTTPQHDRTAELEAALKEARDALRYYGGDKYGTFANEAYAKINEVLGDEL